MSTLMGASRESLAAAQERLDSGVANLSQDDLTQLGDDLFGVADVLYREGRLRRLLADPALQQEAKSQLAADLFGERVSQAALDVVRGLVGARWSRPRDIVDAADLLGVQAVLAAAEQGGQLEEVEDELFRFARILDQQSELQVTLTDLSLPVEPRLGLLDDLLRDKVGAATLRLIQEAVHSPRGRRLDRALDEYVRLAAARRERLIAEVHAAAPLTEQQIERLGEVLSNVYGRRMQVQVAVDPELLGGLTVRVGDEVIEGSVLYRLDRARRQIAG